MTAHFAVVLYTPLPDPLAKEQEIFKIRYQLGLLDDDDREYIINHAYDYFKQIQVS